jgi:hypothetical protein
MTKFPVLKLTINVWYAQSIHSLSIWQSIEGLWKWRSFNKEHRNNYSDLILKSTRYQIFLAENCKYDMSTLNQTGTCQYWESLSKEVLDFIMWGSVSGMSDYQHNVTTDLPQNSD